MAFKQLLLSRAPLSLQAGIPKYCLNLSLRNDYISTTSLSYSISREQNFDCVNSQLNLIELQSRSQLICSSFGLSFKYLLLFFRCLRDSDFVHLQHPDPVSALLSLFLIIVRKPFFITWHAEVYQTYLLARILLPVDLLLALFATHLFTFSPLHLASFRFLSLRYFQKKISIIPLGCVSTKDISASSKPSPCLSDNIKLICVGRLVGYKGFEYAITAISILPANYSLTIVGDGPLLQTLTTLSQRLSVANRVSILPETSDDTKFCLLDAAHIFLLPSITQSEAFGIAQVEAMSRGLPVVASDLGNGVNYVNINDFTGLNVTPRDPFAISRACQYIVSSPSIYTNFSANALENASRFTIELMQATFNETLARFLSL